MTRPDLICPFTMEKMFQIKEVNDSLKRALKLQDKSLIKTEVKMVAHYEALKEIRNGHINISEHMKGKYNTQVGYKLPVVAVYSSNIERLEKKSNLTAKKLRQIINCAINNKIYDNWNKVPLISLGAVRGMSRRSVAMYTDMSYDKVARITEDMEIGMNLGTKYIDQLINVRKYDIVFSPYCLMKNYFEGKFYMPLIDGYKPEDTRYGMNDYILYASHDGAQLERQQAISNALNNSRLRNELKKVGVMSFNNETRVARLKEKYPSFF